MTNIQIEGADDFQQEVVFAAGLDDDIRKGVWEAVRATSQEAVRGIKQRMPVDTGAARARWGSPGAPGGIWEENEGKLEIVQGAALQPYEYILRLNEGYSTQAPAGFIDAEVEKANDKLTEGALNATVKAWDDNG